MDRKTFKEYIKDKMVLLDGATGTELQKRGMPLGVCPEKWVIEHPEVIIEIQKAYIDAGSNIVYSCTFGGNRLKLEEFGLGDKVFEMNKRLAELSREAAGSNAFVAGDLAPTGRFIKPLGDLAFEDCVNVYKEQIKGLLAGGVDLFVIETMMDIQEARAALIAVKESCELPVLVTLSFDQSQRTLTGTDPVTALITLQSLGADAVGCNCSLGPVQMMEFIAQMKPYAKVPLIAKPNAGLPKLVDGKTFFDMREEEFGSYAGGFRNVGVNLIGGCCGTTPEYIRELHKNTQNLKPLQPENNKFSAVTSTRKTVFCGSNVPVAVVGERINPTGKKKLQEELRQGLTDEVRRFAIEQVEKGAHILDVNVGMSGIDEKETMFKLTELLASISEAPLCIDSSSPDVIEAALRIYPGRALINSISQEKVKVEKLLPIAAKYGAMFVLLPLSDNGVPETADKRIEIVNAVFEEASKYGFCKSDIVVDGLVMTVSSNQEAARETLKLIEWCSREFGCGTIVGLSNVSFGLPERSWVNTAFLAMAIDRGLTMAIANPSSDVLMNIKMACDVLTVRDKNSMGYIERFSNNVNTEIPKVVSKESGNTMDRIFEAVVKGDKSGISSMIDNAITEGIKPGDVVDNGLIPAINKVGELFDKKKYFLPQLIQSAETMKTGFDKLEPLLKIDSDTARKATVILATVKGDIHDIGKNIVGLMLKNYGFDVRDLGKDVSAETIIAEAQKTNAEIVGLSALMTTTMVEMKGVISLAKEKGLKSKFMIGGAVVDENYAKEINADGYSKDAYDAVRLAKSLTNAV